MPAETQAALDEVIREPYLRRMRESLRPLVTDDLVARYLTDPFATADAELRRVLTYLATVPSVETLILEREADQRWYVVRLVGSPPARAERVAGPIAIRNEALAVIFRARLAEEFGDQTSAHEAGDDD